VVSIYCCVTIVVVRLLNRSAKAVFATTQLTQANNTVFVIGLELPWHYSAIIRCVIRTCARYLLSWRLVLMEFTSEGRVAIGYSMVLLDINNFV